MVTGLDQGGRVQGRQVLQYLDTLDKKMVNKLKPHQEDSLRHEGVLGEEGGHGGGEGEEL